MNRYMLSGFLFIFASAMASMGRGIGSQQDVDDGTGVIIPSSAELVASSQTGAVCFIEVRAPWMIWCEAVEDLRARGRAGGPYHYWFLFRANIHTNPPVVESLGLLGASNRLPGFQLSRDGIVYEDPRNGSTNVNVYLPKGLATDTVHRVSGVPAIDAQKLIEGSIPASRVVRLLDSDPPRYIVFLAGTGTNSGLFEACHIIVDSNTCTKAVFDLNWPGGKNKFPSLAADARTKSLFLVSRGNIYRIHIRNQETQPTSAGDSSTRATRVSEPPEK